jgi:hypothetical protein
MRAADRHLRPFSAAKEPTAGLRVATAPLLKEEGNAALEALIAKALDPLRQHGAVSESRFAARNQPVDTAEI